jgi:hypothetical protein
VSTEIVVELLALAGVLATAVGTAFITLRKIRRELETQYDLTLRSERLAAYRQLWRLLEPLAKYMRPAPLTDKALETLAGKLRHWYFHTGGIFLSSSSRDAYFALLDELSLRRAHGNGGHDEVPLEVFQRLRKKGSSLRTAMASDVQTRRTSALAGE